VPVLPGELSVEPIKELRPAGCMNVWWLCPIAASLINSAAAAGRMRILSVSIDYGAERASAALHGENYLTLPVVYFGD